MTAIANAVIEKVYPGSEGESEHGPWKAYNFTIEGDDKKFGYFWGEGKPVPREGMMLEVLQYSTTQNGQYTNYKVKKLEIVGNANPAPPPAEAVKTAQGAPQPARPVPVVRKDTKSTFIGFSGLCKAMAAAKDYDKPETLFLDSVKLFEMAEEYVADYWTTLKMFHREVKVRGLEGDFVRFLCDRYEVDSLTEEQMSQTLRHFDKAVGSFNEAEKKANEEIEQTVRDDQGRDAGNREFEQGMDVIPGPGDTPFPDEFPPDHDDEEIPF